MAISSTDPKSSIASAAIAELAKKPNQKSVVPEAVKPQEEKELKVGKGKPEEKVAGSVNVEA